MGVVYFLLHLDVQPSLLDINWSTTGGGIKKSKISNSVLLVIIHKNHIGFRTIGMKLLKPSQMIRSLLTTKSTMTIRKIPRWLFVLTWKVSLYYKYITSINSCMLNNYISYIEILSATNISNYMGTFLLLPGNVQEFRKQFTFVFVERISYCTNWSELLRSVSTFR